MNDGPNAVTQDTTLEQHNHSTVQDWLRLVRPVQWSKNAVVFAGVVFARLVTHPDALLKAFVTFVAFCAIASAVYIFNDWRDIERDRVHPTKRRRPLAAGRIQPRSALIACGTLAMVGCVLGALISWWLLLICVGYLAMMAWYTLELKSIVILDVFVIAAGFILRATSGAVAVGVPVSSWLLLCTFFLSLFLGFGKRRSELKLLEGSAAMHRPSLKGYTIPALDQLIGVTAGATLMAYSMYTFVSNDVPQNDAMMLTIPFVAFALYRYLYLVHGQDLGGSPESLLFRDRPLFLAIVAWGIASLTILAVQ